MYKFFICLFSVLVLSSCGDKTRSKLESGFVFEASQLTFENILSSVIETDCKSCHENYTKYFVAKEKSERMLSRVLNNTMPPSGSLSKRQKAILSAWVRAGSPEFDLSSDSAEDSDAQAANPPVLLKDTWTYMSNTFLSDKCFVCHRPKNESESKPITFDLSTYESFMKPELPVWVFDEFINFKDVDKSYLFQVSVGDTAFMPPKKSGLKKLTEEEYELLRSWILKGAPQD